MSELTIALGASLVQDPTLWRRNADAPAYAQSRPIGAPREITDEQGYVARLMWMSLHREVKLTEAGTPSEAVLYPVCDEITVTIEGFRCLEFAECTAEGLFVPRVAGPRR